MVGLQLRQPALGSPATALQARAAPLRGTFWRGGSSAARLLTARRCPKVRLGTGRPGPVQPRSGYGWPSPSTLVTLVKVMNHLKPLGAAILCFLKGVWEGQHRWMQRWLGSLVLGLAMLTASATSAANIWGVRAVNQRLLPQVQQQVSQLLERDLELGSVRWLAPSGLTGLTPLASVGPVSVGPGRVERSCAMADRVEVGLDLVQSALQRRVVLTARARGLQVHAAQADNFSWFGYPDDTEPSSRNFLPGLRSPGQGSEGGGGGGVTGGSRGAGPGAPSDNGASQPSLRSSGSSASQPPNTGRGGPASSSSSAGSSSSSSRSAGRARSSAEAHCSSSAWRFLESLTQELAQRQAQQAHEQPGPLGLAQDARQQPPAVVLMGLGGTAGSTQEPHSSTATVLPRVAPQGPSQGNGGGGSSVLGDPAGHDPTADVPHVQQGTDASPSSAASTSGSAGSSTSGTSSHGSNTSSRRRLPADFSNVQMTASVRDMLRVARAGGRSLKAELQQPVVEAQQSSLDTSSAANAAGTSGSGWQGWLADMDDSQLSGTVRGVLREAGARGKSLAAQVSKAQAALRQGSTGSIESSWQGRMADLRDMQVTASLRDAWRAARAKGSSLAQHVSQAHTAFQQQLSTTRISADGSGSSESGVADSMDKPLSSSVRDMLRLARAQGSSLLSRVSLPEAGLRQGSSSSAASVDGQASASSAAVGAEEEQQQEVQRDAQQGRKAKRPAGGGGPLSPQESSPDAVPQPAGVPGSVTSSAQLLNRALKPLAAPPHRLYTAPRRWVSAPQPAGRSLQDVAARTAAEASTAGAAPAEAAPAVLESAVVEASDAADPVQQQDASMEEAADTRPAAVDGNGTEASSRRQLSRGAQLINALPVYRATWLQPRQAASDQAGPAAQAAPEPAKPLSAAAQRINAIGVLRPPRQFTAAGCADAAGGTEAFSRAVVDPSTLRKKGGSASLPWAQQRPPASTLIGTRPIPMLTGEPADASAAAATAGVKASNGDAAATAAFEHEATAQARQAVAAEAAAGGDGKHARQHLLHPGYFAPVEGPSYTPAPPEALIDARVRRGNLGALLKRNLRAVLDQMEAPAVVLGTVKADGATLLAHVHGEEAPRRFENVAVDMRLGKDYNSLDLNITALPHERDPASKKCTMLSPHAHRHLRDVTGLSALQRQQEQQLQAEEADGALGQADAEEPAQPEQGGSSTATAGSTSSTSAKPTGGQVRVRVRLEGMMSRTWPSSSSETGSGEPAPELTITVTGKDLHTPLLERLLELPLDISAGRATGEVAIKAHDAASWRFPELYGRVGVRGAEFHFWDATDDIFDASLDLVFEKDRMYLHSATGRFGAVPMALTGDMDLNADAGGQYRLSATVPGVEINQLRATLGVRPTPFPVAGAVAGTLHVTGPIEKPVFSGSAVVVRPGPEMLADCESTDALAALTAEPGAVGAYDKVPFQSAGAVFTLDTKAETMTLHEMYAEPVGGGRLQGSGRMLVSPEAEMDPGAVFIKAEGWDLPAEYIARRYLPEGQKLPPSLVLGRGSVTASMRGAHLMPTIDVSYSLPAAPATGSVQFTREATKLSLNSPYADGAGTMYIQPPSFEAVRAAVTQQQATALSKVKPTGADADITFKSLDVVPLISDEAAMRQVAQQSGQPLRLKLAGGAKLSGTVVQQPASSGSSSEGEAGWVFDGSLGLEGIRINQLRLFQKLQGSLKVSDKAVSVHGKGLRANEILDLDLALPLLPQPPAPAQRRSASAQPTAADAAGQAAVGPAVAVPDSGAVGGGRMQLRCGQLLVAGDIDATGSQLDFKVQSLKLDELELASLRGDLQEASCSLNFGSQTGRGKLSLLAPRFSGLRGDSLSGGFRWERDVVRLDKVLLQQQRSRYEVQGEYVVPPNTRLPTSAADLARQQQPQQAAGSVGRAGPPTGRWRVQINVPAAELQEIMPAARLLQNATSAVPSDYERAKAAFLDVIQKASLRAGDLNTQLRLVAERLAAGAEEQHGGGGTSAASVAGAPPGAGSAVGTGGSSSFSLPSLQELRGQWSGSIQAYGGGTGATSCEFDIKGQAWQWGAHGLDALVANGSYHSEEGVNLQEFVLKAGDAKLLVRGSLLSEHQDATVHMTDFPIATLRPLFRAVPALQRAVPAVPAHAPPVVASPRPLGMLANMVGKATQGLQDSSATEADSPINGLLYVSGNITGSKDQPTGQVVVRLYEAAVGETRLAKAQADARLDHHQQLTFSLELLPTEGHRQSGHVRAAGVIPLSDQPPTAAVAAGSSGGGGPSQQGASSGSPWYARPGLQQQQPLDVRLSVRDGGMAILTSITPDVHWQQGSANIAVRLSGALDKPNVTGAASISKATLECPYLRFPLTNVSAEVHASDNLLTVESVEARVGRKGHVRMSGSLPMYGMAQQQRRLTADVSSVDLRLRNMYTGQYDASLVLTGSLAQPTVGGHMQLSKGTVFLIPAQTTQAEVASVASNLSSVAGHHGGPGQQEKRGAVEQVFELLTRGESSLAQQFEDVMKHEVEELEAMVEEAGGQHNVTLDRLSLQLGPDLRAVYPLVMNFSVSGELEASGPAHPDQLAVAGVMQLPSGDINLVATQLALDRDHANRITFVPGEQGGVLDPLVDLVMVGGDLRISIQGKASEWQDHLVLQYVGNKASAEGAEQLDASEAARIFEDKLKSALLAEDGQLALSRLAGSTVSTLMPKIETQGQVGGTKWRLVSAPAIPGLLEPGAASSAPANLLANITLGTEVEVQFGQKLTAGMVRKLREGSEVATQWNLQYNLSRRLRMQFQIDSAPPYARTLLFTFTSSDS